MDDGISYQGNKTKPPAKKNDDKRVQLPGNRGEVRECGVVSSAGPIYFNGDRIRCLIGVWHEDIRFIQRGNSRYFS